MKNNMEYFKLYSNCIPVKGAKNQIICDLQYNRFIAIPEIFLSIYTDLSKKTILEIKSYYSNEIDAEIDNLFSTLVNENWGFYTSEPLSFPAVDLSFHTAHAVSNAIIDIDDASNFDIQKVAFQLNELGCKQVQIRFFKPAIGSELEHVLASFAESGVDYIEMLVQNLYDPSPKEVVKIFENHLRLRRLIVFNQATDDLINFDSLSTTNLGELMITSQELKNVFQCGNIHKNYFNANMSLFSESLQFNNCLHKKISIDAAGNIKNCPSMNKHYGNISDTPLKVVLAKKDFTQLWDINKDKINVCKDCEFRYICTDCRAYLEDPHDLYSKPLKCGYDPYTGVWQNWKKEENKTQTFKHYEAKPVN